MYSEGHFMPKRGVISHEDSRNRRLRPRTLYTPDPSTVIDWEEKMHLFFPTMYNPSYAIDGAYYKAHVRRFIQEYPTMEIKSILAWIFSVGVQRPPVLLNSILINSLLIKEFEGLTGSKHIIKIKLLAIILHHGLPESYLSALFQDAKKMQSCLSSLHWAIITNEPITDAMKPYADAHSAHTPAFHLAAYLNNINAVTNLCRLGANINAKNISQVTALWIAARLGYTAMVGRLLECGASVNEARIDDNTLFHMVAEFGHAEVIFILLTKLGLAGADVFRNNGDTPLFLAARNNHVAVVDTLLKYENALPEQTIRKPFLEQTTNSGETIFHIAAQNGHVRLVNMLLPKLQLFGANAPRNDGETPLFLAVKKNHVAVVDVLLEYGDVFFDQTTSSGENILHIAAQYGCVEMVRFLLQKWCAAMINEKTINGESALHLAARYGHIEVIKILMLYGASDGMDALKLVIELRKHAVRDVLFKYLFLEQTTSSGETVLHLAAQNGDAELLQSLLQKCCIVMINAKTIYGESALQLAARYGHIEAIKALVLSGASDGMDVLKRAVETEDAAIIDVLFDAGLCVFPISSWLEEELEKRKNYNASIQNHSLKPMPLGIHEQGTIYINLAIYGELWACRLLEEHNQKVPGALVTWMSNADEENKFSFFCIILRLVSIRLTNKRSVTIRLAEKEAKDLYEQLTYEKVEDPSTSSLLSRLVNRYDSEILKQWSDALASAPEARALGACFERLKERISIKIAEKILVNKNHINGLFIPTDPTKSYESTHLLQPWR